jgi:hypothetical protein
MMYNPIASIVLGTKAMMELDLMQPWLGLSAFTVKNYRVCAVLTFHLL